MEENKMYNKMEEELSEDHNHYDLMTTDKEASTTKPVRPLEIE